jgi:hypothetical protein
MSVYAYNSVSLTCDLWALTGHSGLVIVLPEVTSVRISQDHTILKVTLAATPKAILKPVKWNVPLQVCGNRDQKAVVPHPGNR